MKKITFLMIGFLLIYPTIIYAGGISKPTRITDFDQNGLVTTNEILENICNWINTFGNIIWTTTGLNIYYNLGNVGIGTSNPLSRLDIIGTIKTTDTVPLMRLSIYNPDATMDGVGGSLSKTKNYILDKTEAIITAGTNVIFTLKVVDTNGVTSLGNLTAGQTATTSLLTITSFTGGTIPSGKLLILDTDSTSSTGTNTMFRLEVHGHEQ